MPWPGAVGLGAEAMRAAKLSGLSSNRMRGTVRCSSRSSNMGSSTMSAGSQSPSMKVISAGARRQFSGTKIAPVRTHAK